MQPRCFGCHKLTKSFATCKSCRSWLSAHSVTVAVPYEGFYKALLHAYKFGPGREAAEQICHILSESFYVKVPDIICYIPTAPSRIRQRGFDHAKVLTDQFCRKSGLPRVHSNALARHGNMRQLGATRSQRLRPMKQEIHLSKKVNVQGKTVLIIDDMITTGASISAAAHVLKKAGAKRVDALIFAQKIT